MNATPTPDIPTPDPSEDRPDHTLLFLIHGSIRTDLDRLATAVAHLDVDDRATAELLGRWFEGFRSALEVHHRTEDEIMFPELAARAGDRFFQLDRLEADHQRLDDLLVDVTRHLDDLATAGTGRAASLERLRTDVTGLQYLMQAHLDVEDTEVVPLLDEYMTAADLERIGEEAGKMHKPAELRFMLPWLFAHADAEVMERLLPDVPLAIRVVERVFRRRYLRLDQALTIAAAGATDDATDDATVKPVVERRSAALVALAGAAIALVFALGGCGADTESGASAGPEGESASASEAPSTVDITTTDHHFEPSVDTAAAGQVTLSVTNDGEEPHQLHLAKVDPGVTAESFIEQFETEGEQAAMSSVEWVGGVGSVEPGATVSSTSELEAGDYLMICFIPTPGPDGESHVMKQMVAPLTVVDAATAPAPTPEVDATVVLDDYMVELPEDFTGGQVLVRNEGAADHEMVVMRFEDGKSVTDLIDWQSQGMPADRPFEYVGGVGSMEPGRETATTLDLRPGNYIALCVVPGPEGAPHVEMGMVTTFTIP